MDIIESKLPGVMVLAPKVFGDERGFFLETFRQETFEKAGIVESFVQSNHSRSRQGILRGLHYQLEKPQGKLVRVARGRVFDVAVDVRSGSPNFGEWFGIVLDDVDMRMLYVPPGFAHGFAVLSETADFIYHCTDYYHPASEYGIAWNDPNIGIDWPLTDPLLSEKDLKLPMLAEQSVDNLPNYAERP